MEMQAKNMQEENASVDKRKRETENAQRTAKTAELMVNKFKKQYDDLKAKRDKVTDQKDFMWYENQMAMVMR